MSENGDTEDSSDSESYDGPFSFHPLHEFNKDHVSENRRVKKAATQLMRQRLTQSAEIIIQVAEENMKKREGGQVEREDVQRAFDEVLRPYNLMDDFLTTMEEFQYELQREADRTHVLEFDDVDESPEDADDE